MGESLPEKFPEYSIMHKTISNQIKSLQGQKESQHDIEKKEEIQERIKMYRAELKRIERKFPSGFFPKEMPE